MSGLKDPIVVDPAGFDQKSAWGECNEYVEKCGGLSHSDGEPNWRAAFGADPGCCSCPCCDQMFWAWGRKQRCSECGFEFPTHWWSDYSSGAQHAMRVDDPPPAFRDPEVMARMNELHEKRMATSKYYRFAFEHRCTPSMEAAKTIAWRTFFPEDAKQEHTNGPMDETN